MVGRNWLFRAQKSLAKIQLLERSLTNSDTSLGALSTSEEQRSTTRYAIEAEECLSTADFVEARGILLPSIEYLKRAVDAARVQGKLTGSLLSTVSLVSERSLFTLQILTDAPRPQKHV